jgi:hypothetical protein
MITPQIFWKIICFFDAQFTENQHLYPINILKKVMGEKLNKITDSKIGAIHLESILFKQV